jgi:DNA polymerase, archaea type
VAMGLLGEGKDDFDSSKTWQAWAAGGAERQRLLDYNAKDVELLPKIEAHTGFATLFDTLAEVTGVFPHTLGLEPTQFVDSFMLRLASGSGTRFPTLDRNREKDKYGGAYVMQPRENGILRNVHVADFASLYPSIILAWNMSPETWKLVSPNGPIPEGMCRTPTTYQGFTTGEDGMLPRALRQVLELRKEWKNRKNAEPPGTDAWKDADRRSTAYKVAANSFYGVIGSVYSRYYDRRVAESVSLSGKWLIEKTIEAAKEKGWKVNYADSVTGDRTVLVKDAHGDIDAIPIEEIWERSKAKARRPDGKQTALLPGWRALARASNGKVGWYPIDSIVRHKTMKELWKISTKRGQTEVTQDHGIVVGDESITPAEFIARGAKFDCVKPPVEALGCDVDLWSYLKRATFTREYKGRLLERRFELVDDDEWIVLGGWGSPVHKIRRCYRTGTPEMHALLRLVAAYIAEGSASIRGVTACRYMWSIARDEAAWLEALKVDLELICPEAKVFGPHRTSGAYVLRSGTATMAAAFATIAGHTSKGKKLPSFIHTLSVDEFATFFAVMAQGEGEVVEQKYSRQYGYTSTSQRLVAGLSYALAARGYEHAVWYRAEKKSWSIRTRPAGSERDRKTPPQVERRRAEEWVYDLSVPGANNFVDGIGRVLLHNTDSVFVAGPSRTAFKEFVNECNEDLYPQLLAKHGCKENPIKLAYEKEFDRLVFVAAKRYAGSYAHADGKEATAASKPEIKGLEYKRGDASKLARALQEKVVMMILRGEESVEAYRAVIDEARSHVLEDELPVEEVTLSKGLSKPIKEYEKPGTKKDGSAFADLAHVAVAKELAKRGLEVGEGTRIEYVVLDSTTTPTKVIPSSDYTGEVDRHYTWETLVWPATQRLLLAAFPSQDWTSYDRTRPPKPRGKAARVPEEQRSLEQAAPLSVWVDSELDELALRMVAKEQGDRAVVVVGETTSRVWLNDNDEQALRDTRDALSAYASDLRTR